MSEQAQTTPAQEQTKAADAKPPEATTQQADASQKAQPQGEKAPEAKPADQAKAQETAKVDDKSKEKADEGKTTEAKTTEDKQQKKDETKKDSGEKPVVPEKYDLKLPKDSSIDASRLEKIASFAKEQGLTQEQAQALVEREHNAVSSEKAAQLELMNQKQSEWKQAIESDKELGGQNLKPSVEYAKRALDRFGSDTLRKQLNDTGMGNHPELVRVFARIGKAMADDSLVLPGSRESGQRSVEQVLYGESQNS